MKVIIAGSRGITDEDFVHNYLDNIPHLHDDITEVVSGGARGVDSIGEAWAGYYGIPVSRFIPDWDAHGKKAGILRNIEMALYADALVAFWDGKSRGTKHMIEAALKGGLRLYVVTV